MGDPHGLSDPFSDTRSLIVSSPFEFVGVERNMENRANGAESFGTQQLVPEESTKSSSGLRFPLVLQAIKGLLDPPSRDEAEKGGSGIKRESTPKAFFHVVPGVVVDPGKGKFQATGATEKLFIPEQRSVTTRTSGGKEKMKELFCPR